MILDLFMLKPIKLNVCLFLCVYWLITENHLDSVRNDSNLNVVSDWTLGGEFGNLNALYRWQNIKITRLLALY